MTDRKCPVCGKRSMEEHGMNPGDRHYWFCRNCGSQLFGKPQDWLNGQQLYDSWANSCMTVGPTVVSVVVPERGRKVKWDA